MTGDLGDDFFAIAGRLVVLTTLVELKVENLAAAFGGKSQEVYARMGVIEHVTHCRAHPSANPTVRRRSRSTCLASKQCGSIGMGSFTVGGRPRSTGGGHRNGRRSARRKRTTPTSSPPGQHRSRGSRKPLRSWRRGTGSRTSRESLHPQPMTSRRGSVPVFLLRLGAAAIGKQPGPDGEVT